MAGNLNWKRCGRDRKFQENSAHGGRRMRELLKGGPPPTTQQKLTVTILSRRAGLTPWMPTTQEAAELEIARLRQVCETRTAIKTSRDAGDEAVASAAVAA